MHKSHLLGAFVAITAMFACGCERRETPKATPSDAKAPDNTDRNKRDRDGATKTPLDQSDASSDVKITAAIRRSIMDDKSMSVDAQNCKIIADKSGVVTLRGPVASQAEKDSIEAKAKAVAGVNRVDNQLEVK